MTMRFPEDKIQNAILHPDLEVRAMATRYFSDSFSPDRSVMPLVIEAIETFGRETAIDLIGAATTLAQTEETITWIIDELNNEKNADFENYAYNLSRVLANGRAELLLPRRADVLNARLFGPEQRDAVSHRLELLSWDAATCWQKLETFCEESKDRDQTGEVDWDDATRIAEALARFGPECEERVLSLLRQEVGDFHLNPMKWWELLAVQLAGEARLESAIPLLVGKLHQDDDILAAECERALIGIGSTAVIAAIAESFPTAEHHFRIYALGVMEHIPSDLTVETCVRLLAQNDDDEQDDRMQMAEVLLRQFATEGIEPARQLLLERELEFESISLRNCLLTTCTLMGETFPEYEAWLAAEKQEKAEHLERIQQLDGDPTSLLLYAIEKLAGIKTPRLPPVRESLSFPSEPVLSLAQPTVSFESEQVEWQRPIVSTSPKIGRNETCPCGSGKKFKNCCLRTQGR